MSEAPSSWVPVADDQALPSDSRFRADLASLKQGAMREAQRAKEEQEVRGCAGRASVRVGGGGGGWGGSAAQQHAPHSIKPALRLAVDTACTAPTHALRPQVAQRRDKKLREQGAAGL